MREARKMEKQRLQDDFIDLLYDHDVSIDSSWSKLKKSLRDEPRYANGKLRSEEREKVIYLF